jgi:muramoyltetrapeptide carboxypeptidase
MMHQLILAGKIGSLAGLLIGDFTEMKDNESPFGQNVEEIILEIVKDYNFPVCFGFKAGHGDVNLALRFGTEWKLAVDESIVKLSMV